jgi:predicted transcriptional regulator
MPRYTPLVAKAKAEKLIKDYTQKGFNQSRLAESEGVSQPAINQRLSKKPVRDTLQEYLDSPKLHKELENVAKEGLRAKNFTKRGMKPDHDARHKYWRDLMTSCGKLKMNGNGSSVSIFNVFYGYRKEQCKAQ